MNQLDRIESLCHLILKVVIREGDILMSVGQDILDAVTAETTAVDSMIAFVNGLVANNTISPATASAIIAAATSSKDKLEAAIVANTSPPPPVV